MHIDQTREIKLNEAIVQRELDISISEKLYRDIVISFVTVDDLPDLEFEDLRWIAWVLTGHVYVKGMPVLEYLRGRVCTCGGLVGRTVCVRCGQPKILAKL